MQGQKMFNTFGFSGSRSISPTVSKQVFSLASSCSSLGSVLVGCAKGTDQAVFNAVPSARVFSVSGSRSWQLVARSVHFVQSLAAAKNPVLVSFPSGACPQKVAPSRVASRCFSGHGSGSWASLALAVGLGVPVRVFLPLGTFPPSSWGSWSVVPSGLFSGAFLLNSNQNNLFN